MAKLLVEITSKDMIKPSSPTPNHLKTLEFSFQDQISPDTLMPFVFFYESYGENYSETTKLLKESLSETLVQFYPFAGRIGDLCIDCNDEGVPFNEANVEAILAQVMRDPNNSEELLSLLPFLPNSGSKCKEVAGIQVNRFSCGGVAIGFSLSHKVADAETYIAFISAWAKTARGDSSNDNATQIKFVGTSFFPQINLGGMDEEAFKDSDFKDEKVVTKRLTFTKDMIVNLKNRFVGGVQATTVQAISAFLWKQFIRVARVKPTPINTLGVIQAVNLRSVNLSGIPKNSCVNIFTVVMASTPVDTEIEYPEAVDKLRNAVKEARTSSFFSEKMQTGLHLMESKVGYEKIIEQGGEFCFFTDLTKFPVYQVNFGWGTPLWVSIACLPPKNFVVMMKTKCGEGIEVWMNVLEQDVAAFEEDHEFDSLMFS